MGSIYNPLPPDLVGRSIFGNGSSGDIVEAADVTNSTDIYAEDYTVNAGVTVTMDNCRLFVKGTLINNGIINTTKNNGSNGTAATGGGGGAGAAANSFIAQPSGGNGGAPTINGANAADSLQHIGNGAGNGGDGAATAGGSKSGLGGVDIGVSYPYYFPSALYLASWITGIIVRFGTSAAGGGGGGASVTGGGGGGGSAVAPLVICARRIINNGVFTVAGTNGGNAYALSADAAGGGGAGAGGLAFLIYNYYTGNLPVRTAGVGGQGAAGGINGGNSDPGAYYLLPNVQ